MASEKPGAHAEMPADSEIVAAAESWMLSTERAGQSDAPKGSARSHTLMMLINERPGSLDRVVGLLRRRRANLQTLIIGRSEQPDVTRITAVTDDSTVAIDQLIEQLRKVFDVREVSRLTSDGMVERELALLKVANDPQRADELKTFGQQHGARIVDEAADAVTFEVSGTSAQIEQFIQLFQPFGVREVARTGSVAMPRGTK